MCTRGGAVLTPPRCTHTPEYSGNLAGEKKKGNTTLRVPKSSLTSVLTKPVAA